LDLYFSLGFTGIIREFITRLPELYTFIFLRPSAHVLLREQCPEAEYCIVIPELRYKYETYTSIKEVATLVNEPMNNKRAEELIFRKFLIGELLKAKLYLSPPRNLEDLAREVKGSYLALDVDVDYIAEFQNECYTRAASSKCLEALGKFEEPIKFIQHVKPGLIVVSEFTLNALKRRTSFTRRFMETLRNMGYNIEYGYLSPSDKKARKIIKKTRLFSLKARYIVLKVLHEKVKSKEIDSATLEAIDHLILHEFVKDFGDLIK